MARYLEQFRASPVDFVRRVPAGLQWRIAERLVPVQRSAARRELAARAVRSQRALRRAVKRAGSRQLVLRLANAHASQIPELHWFREEVEGLSNGTLRIAFVNTWTTPDNTREETTTMQGVISGRADLGWAGTRAFGVLGVRSLDPLQAPLLFAEYGSLGAVVGDELMYEMMEPLERLDLVGLVVLPGGLRKPFAFTRRLLSPRDYEGTRLRIHESLVAEATYRRLGAEAVALSVYEMASQAMNLCDGLDIQTEALRGWNLRGSITYNVNLWPRTLAVAASQRSFAWLAEPERELLREASRRTLARALEHLRDQAERDWSAIPPSVNPIMAAPEDVAGVRDKVEPVHEDLRRHPETSAFYRRLVTLVERNRSDGASERS